MNQNIDKLRELWQSEKSKSSDPHQLVEVLKKNEKKAKLERSILFIAVPLTTIFLAIILPIFQSKYFFLSLLFMGAAMFMILFQVYKNKPVKVNGEADFDNQHFIEAQIKQLKTSIFTTSKYMWIYSILLIVGLNLSYLEILKDLNLSLRFAIQFSFSIFFFFLMYAGIKKRMKQNKIELFPLIEQLEKIKGQIETV